ncbi:hypothetical protein [Streptomyces noursei]|uniref:hypothetical protein n=1 Tax=Streptomyces noursei TaxID=1971 RepID=UPI001966C9D3|nr:hypothetical protein [Streptomyces noursei]QRX95772.1 hypothetical protein JNO44_37765 [Streptomyces noursei]
MESARDHVVHQLLTEVMDRLTVRPDSVCRPLHELLAQSAVDLYDRNLLGDQPLSLGSVVDEAAACLLNLANPQRATLRYDEDLLSRLSGLDRLPRTERICLLDAAVRRTAPAAT